jgi:hypothetical protein
VWPTNEVYVERRPVPWSFEQVVRLRGEPQTGLVRLFSSKYSQVWFSKKILKILRRGLNPSSLAAIAVGTVEDFLDSRDPDLLALRVFRQARQFRKSTGRVLARSRPDFRSRLV